MLFEELFDVARQIKFKFCKTKQKARVRSSEDGRFAFITEALTIQRIISEDCNLVIFI